MAITADTPRMYDPAVPPIFVDLPAKAAVTLYEGACVSDEGGAGTVDDLAASESFIGFVDRKCDNSAGAAGALKVKIRSQGVIKNLAVTGLDATTDFGVAVYASDNGTFSLTSTTTYVQIGKVVGYSGTSGYGDVFFQGAHVRSV